MAGASWDVADYCRYDDLYQTSLDPEFLAGNVNTNNQSVTDMNPPDKHDYLHVPGRPNASFHSLWVPIAPNRSMLTVDANGHHYAVIGDRDYISVVEDGEVLLCRGHIDGYDARLSGPNTLTAVIETRYRYPGQPIEQHFKPHINVDDHPPYDGIERPVLQPPAATPAASLEL